MRQRTFRDLTDLSVDQILNGLRRGSLPLPAKGGDIEGRRRTYDLDDVVACLVCDALVGRRLDAATVSDLILSHWDALQALIRIYDGAPSSAFFGVARVTWQDASRTVQRLAVVVGTAPNLRALTRTGPAPLDDIDGDVVSLALANVTEILRAVRRRAEVLGIDLAEEVADDA